MKRSLAILFFCVSAFAQMPLPGPGGGGSGSSSGPTVFPIGFNFGDGTETVATQTQYLQVPFGCTITAWNIIADSGTVTVRVLREATGGTTLPDSSDSINTSGVSLSTGNRIRSTTLSDFTALTISPGDVLGFEITAVSSATKVHFSLECSQ